MAGDSKTKTSPTILKKRFAKSKFLQNLFVDAFGVVGLVIILVKNKREGNIISFNKNLIFYSSLILLRIFVAIA